MQILYPYILFFSLAIAIPIIIHLFYYKKTQKIFFSNIRFIETLKIQYAGKKNVKNLLILLLRCLAILFLVLAFAQPYFIGDTVNKSNESIIIYIDNSPDMQRPGNKHNTLLDEAKEIALSFLNAKSRGKIILLSNDRYQFNILSHDDAKGVLKEIKVGNQFLNLEQIFIKILQASGHQNFMENSTVLLLSSFQENMLSSPVVLPQNKIILKQLKSPIEENVAIDTAWISNPTILGDEKLQLIYRVSHQGKNKYDYLPVSLFLDGKKIKETSLNLKRRSAVYDTLYIDAFDKGWQSLLLRISSQDLLFDNELPFTVNISNKINIMIINGIQPNAYLSQLFSPNNSSFFNLSQYQQDNIPYDQIDNYDFIILNELNNIPSGLITKLEKELSKGKGILVLPPAFEYFNQEDYQRFANQLKIKPLEGVSKHDKPKLWDQNTLKHPFFSKMFEKKASHILMPIVKQNYRFKDKNEIGHQSIFAIDKSPLVLAYPLYSGFLYMFAFPLQADYTNFFEHGLFLPSFYQMILDSGFNYPPYYVIKPNILVPVPQHIETQDLKVSLEKKGFQIVPNIVRKQQQFYFSFDHIGDISGVFSLKKDEKVLAKFAFIPSRSESKMSFLSQGNIRKILADKQVVFIETGASIQSFSNNRQYTIFNWPLWKYALLLAFLTLLLELVMLYRNYKLV